jgi:hypothetical protein
MKFHVFLMVLVLASPLAQARTSDSNPRRKVAKHSKHESATNERTKVRRNPADDEFKTDGTSIYDSETGDIVERDPRPIITPESPAETTTDNRDNRKDNEPSPKSVSRLPPVPEMRERNFNVAAQVSPLGLYVPFKFGLSGTYRFSPRLSGTIEGLMGSIGANFYIANLGSVNEKRLNFLIRHKPGTKTFQLIYGVGYNATTVDVGNSYTERLSGGALPGEYRMLSVEAITGALGFGNKWEWDNGVSLGVDWAVVYIPLARTKVESRFLDIAANEGDRSDANDTLNFLKYVPTVALFNLGLGYSF